MSSVALGSFSEVVRSLIRSRLFFLDLSQQIVEQRAGTEAIPRRVEPRVAEGFLHCYEIVERLLRVSDSTGRLHSDRNSRRQIEVANGLDHHLGVGERRTARCFAGTRL